jgi:hypothetical protein
MHLTSGNMPRAGRTRNHQGNHHRIPVTSVGGQDQLPNAFVARAQSSRGTNASSCVQMKSAPITAKFASHAICRLTKAIRRLAEASQNRQPRTLPATMLCHWVRRRPFCHCKELDTTSPSSCAPTSPRLRRCLKIRAEVQGGSISNQLLADSRRLASLGGSNLLLEMNRK